VNMRVNYRLAALIIPLSVSLIGCSAEGEPTESVESAESTSPGDDVTLTKERGKVRLQVRTGSRKLSEVRDRSFAEKAVRELKPTLKQLQKAGVSASEDQLTLSRLEETLILDSETYRVESHRFRFGFLIPYGGQDITYGQDVNEENRGVFDGDIELPAGVN
jgi:hypothetical protein